jgi:hypothetical protein
VSPSRTGPIGCLLLALTASVFLAPKAAAADSIDAVTTPGSGTLTVCRSWIVYNSCTTYHKVPLPDQVAVGDNLKLIFGSNPKDYLFHVVSIRSDGGNCTVLSDVSGGREDGEKLEVSPCRTTAKPASEKR